MGPPGDEEAHGPPAHSHVRMSVWLKKAEELLQSADRRAGAELERVKERVGITPVVDDPEADDCSSALGASVVVLSAAAGARHTL